VMSRASDEETEALQVQSSSSGSGGASPAISGRSKIIAGVQNKIKPEPKSFASLIFLHRTLSGLTALFRPTTSEMNKIGSECEGKYALIGGCFQDGCRSLLQPGKIKEGLTKCDGRKFGQSYNFEIKEGECFRRIRDVTLRCTEYHFVSSICKQEETTSMTTFKRIAEAAGKSNAFFFLSHDEAFFFKTLPKRDAFLLLKILPSYEQYMTTNRDSLLPRFYGLFTLRMSGSKTLNFVCMNNFYAGKHEIHVRYDLKGSTHGRKASEREKCKSHPVLKDLDWRGSDFTVSIPSKSVGDILKDCQFLASEKLFDYSLLVGIHAKIDGHEQYDDADDPKNDEAYLGVVSLPTENHIFYIGIVDILTRYGFRKKLETFFTGTLFGHDVSCQPPDFYAKRFSDLVSQFRGDTIQV